MNRILACTAFFVLAACRADRDRFFFETSDGARLYTTVDGRPSDTLILVLHGGPLGDSHVYNGGGWADRLEEQAQVAYFDQRGQGASRGAYDRDAYDPARAAEDVAEIATFLRLRYEPDHLVLFGHSWGGMLGTLSLLDTDVPADGWIETAGCHDSLVHPRYATSALREIGGAEIAADRSVEEWTEILSFVDTLDLDSEIPYSDLVTLNRLSYRAEGLIEDIEFDTGSSVVAALGQALARPARGSVARWAGSSTLSEFSYAIEEIGLTPRLGEIRLPTLLLYGRYDFVCPPALGRDADQRMPNATLVIQERSGHSLMFHEPDVFSAAIDTFLADLGQPQDEGGR
jgi:pimeloyl-ACP methyl ester carboxylesterase